MTPWSETTTQFWNVGQLAPNDTVQYHKRNTSNAPLRDAENSTLETLNIKSVVEQNTQNCQSFSDQKMHNLLTI
jgi:hypothetical protein